MTVSETDSILNSVKKMIGGESALSDTSFDTALIIHINSALRVLNQLGVGEWGFNITGEEETWEDFCSGIANLSEIKSYVYMKVKMIFDPPESGTAANALNEAIKEFEWRANVQVDPGGMEELL